MNTIIPIILIIISGSIFFFHIDPTYDGSATKQGVKQLLKDRNKINFQTNKIREIQKKKRELEKVYKSLNAGNEDSLENLSKMVPDNMENARLVNYIYTIKQESRVSGMSDLRITTESGLEKKKNGKIVIKEEEDFKSVNLAFSFTSDYKNFISFINDLYKSLRIVDIVSINFKPEYGFQDENLSQDKFSFNIIIRTYWLNKK